MLGSLINVLSLKSIKRKGYYTLQPTPEQKKMSKEINAFKKEQIKWLKQLNSIDSNPNDGRVDISVFNEKVAIYGWKPSSTTHTIRNKYGKIEVEMNSVDIEEQAESMTKQHFGEDKIKAAQPKRTRIGI